jgi:hypothetical protein
LKRNLVGQENGVERRIALFTAAAMLMVLLTFFLTVINSSNVREMNPIVKVGALYSLLFSESIPLACGLLAAKVRRGNSNIRLILSGLVMALMTGDASNDIIQMLLPGQVYLAAVAPVIIPAGVMAFIAIDMEESR